MNLKQQSDYLFNPRSVAVVGASNVFGKWGLFGTANTSALPDGNRRETGWQNNTEC